MNPAPPTELTKPGIFALLALFALGCSGASEGPVEPAPGKEAAPAATADSRGSAPLAGSAPATETSPAPASASASAPATAEANTPGPLPGGTKVLHIGDSFAGALGLPLGALLEGEGVRSVLKHTDASYLTDWAWDGSLTKYLWKYNPDLVLVTLGANELAIATPAQREKTVRKIVETIGERPCVWVAIPLWDGSHNGLMDVIRESSAPCVFYDTNREIDVAHMPRISDGIHPTTAARAEWAKTLFAWLKAHRAPIEGAPWKIRP